MTSPDHQKLGRIWRISIAAGLSATIGATLAAFPTPTLSAFAKDWIWIVMTLGVGVLVQSAAFYIWTSLAEPEFGRAAATAEETGDATEDGWVRAYLGARNATATMASALLIGAIAWFFF